MGQARLRNWIQQLAVVIYQLGVHSSAAIALVAVTIGVSFALAGSLIPPLSNSQLLRLFTLLTCESVGVLLTLLLFLIRGVLPLSLLVHLMEQWPGARLRLGRLQLTLGAGLAAAVLFLQYVLFSLVALSYASDNWLDFSDLAAVLEIIQPLAVLLSCGRVALFAMLATVAVLSRCWPLQVLEPARPMPDEPFDPWRPHRQLPMAQLTMVYSDLFRLILLLIPLELGYQVSGLPGALSA